MSNCEKAQYITKCLQLAIMLEFSVEKPGNVSFVSSFEGTRVEHFLASAVAAGPSFQEAAHRGILVAEKRLDIGKVGIGELIKSCISEVVAWQRGGRRARPRTASSFLMGGAARALDTSRTLSSSTLTLLLLSHPHPSMTRTS